MIVPRRLHKTALNPPYDIVEEDDPRQAWILCGAGTEYTDEDARRLGITDYLAAYDKAHAPEKEKPVVKAVEKSEVEDKAVAGPGEVKAETEEPTPPVEADA